MKRFFAVITARRFWLNILIIGLFIIAILFTSLYLLRVYTQHGESTTVPDLRNYTVEQMAKLLENADLQFEITDSIYNDDLPRGVVITQNPDPNVQVKQGRTIFVTVNSMLPELVEVPDLVGKSRRIALSMLDITGLKLDKLVYQPDVSCTDCVLAMRYEGREIKAGDQIRKGEKVTIVLGEFSTALTSVPRLLGRTYQEAAGILVSQSLNVGEIKSCKGCKTGLDSLNAFVANQMPSADSEVNLGSEIDLYLTTDPSVFNSFEQDNDTYEDN